MPYYPSQSSRKIKHGYYTETSYERMVAEYANISIPEVFELNWIDYLVLRRDAFIYNLSQNEDGVKHLENAWRLSEINPDVDSLRDMMKKGQ